MAVQGANRNDTVSGVHRPQSARPSQGRRLEQGKNAFRDALKAAEAKEGLIFSRHAEERLKASGRPLGDEALARLEEAVETAGSKGARSTLVLMDGVAFVVAPRSKTVITVIPAERMSNNVFTAIDSAVVVENKK